MVKVPGGVFFGSPYFARTSLYATIEGSSESGRLDTADVIVPFQVLPASLKSSGSLSTKLVTICGFFF